MKEFEPSNDFVLNVMGKVRACESREEVKLRLSTRLLNSKPLKYALSGSGIFLGIFLTPIVCM